MYMIFMALGFIAGMIFVLAIQWSIKRFGEEK